jgi:predicted Zn-ribbon and HTH transcriptional regulator
MNTNNLEQMNANCVDCGNEYELDALNLDLRCASCVEQWSIDELEEASK